jgi:cyclopropane fatty-acyl-phospholipid synthase-like methyltransferase
MPEKSSYQQPFEKEGAYYASDRAEILPFVPATIKTSLEFGCGQGGFSSLIKQHFGAEAWAVELHREAAEIAAGKLDRVINLDAIAALEQLPDRYFDSIFFLDVLEHLVDPYTLLERVGTKLSDCGVAIASIPNIRYYRALKNYAWRGTWEYKDSGIMDIGHLRFFTHGSIRRMFENAGYALVTLQGIHESESSGCKILNAVTFGRFWDCRYKHFIAVARPRVPGE